MQRLYILQIGSGTWPLQLNIVHPQPLRILFQHELRSRLQQARLVEQHPSRPPTSPEAKQMYRSFIKRFDGVTQKYLKSNPILLSFTALKWQLRPSVRKGVLLSP